MPTPQELLPEAAKFFFQRVLPEATGRTFAQLASPSVHLGSYVKYEGGPVTTSLGQQLTPTHCLKVSAALPVQGGLPNLAGAAAPTNGNVTHLLWVRHVADVATDNEAEIQRVMADLDSFQQLAGAPAPAAGNGSGASPDGGAPASPAPALAAAALRSADWARAVAASKSALAVNLSTLTAVPEPLRELVDDLPALLQVLGHFFTYTMDGAYYRRWSGAGRDPTKADHLTPEYKQHNVREVVLSRDRLYLYAVVPEGLLAGGGDLGGVFREVVFRFDETLDPERPFTTATVHTARWRRDNAPFEDFVFFYAEQGAGVPIPREAKVKMSAPLVEFLGHLAAAEAQRTTFLDQSDFVVKTDDGSYMALLVARVKEDATLPDYALSDTGQADRDIQVPPDKIVDLALLPTVEHLALASRAVLELVDAKRLIHYDNLVAKIGAAKRGGKGVVVGIIDSGIDGNHPAFAGRLHSFWDQASSPLVAGKSPKANNPGKAAYKLLNFGAELTGADVSKAQDQHPRGHGTHVAGIAAGAEVKDASGAVLLSAGLAPQATIVAVRSIGVGAGAVEGLSAWVFGARYIIQKAAELGMPCVINMSFGSHVHAHDGSDPNSRALYEVLTERGKYRQGRVVVAAAGNERTHNIHVRRTLPANSSFVTIATVDMAARLEDEAVIVWIKSPTSTCPVAFPLDLYVYRVSTPPSGDATPTVRIGQQATAIDPARTFASRRTRISISSQLSNPINGDHEYQLLFETTDPTQAKVATRWGIGMINGDSHPLDVHLWIIKDPAKSTTAFVGATGADDTAYLVGAPAASAAAIAVGSMNSVINWTSVGGPQSLPASPPPPPVGELSAFSSPGPLRDSSIPGSSFYRNPPTHEINGVDCTAPGCMIQSALSDDIPAAPPARLQMNARALMLSGTSMASPVVAGLVANLLAEEPKLTLPQVLDRLKAASSVPATSKFQPPSGSPGTKPLSRDWGYGLVDAGKLKP
jgi:subtilisin family serine protease